jgi:hypothetical protein
MLNPFHEVNWQPHRAERRRFAVSLMIGFPMLGAGLALIHGWPGSTVDLNPALALGGGGLALGATLWVLPQLARPFYLAWYFAACCAGFVVGNVLLSGVYFFVFAPVGLMLRGLGRRAFRKTFDRRAPSYWRDAPPTPKPETYFRQF